MGKTVEDICNLFVKNTYELPELEANASDNKTLSSCISVNNPFISNSFAPLYEYDDLYNTLERLIMKELAQAVDNNSVSRIKRLKNKYGHLKEFSDAKKFLNKKCKEIWNVYEPVKNLPKEAMKALGITNEPELDFLLKNSIKFYEKDNSNTTAYIISSILKNDNLSYTMDDIHQYLKNMNRKHKCNYNLKTVMYLIEQQKYTRKKLEDLGIKKDLIKQALDKTSLKNRLKFYLENFDNLLNFIHKTVQN